MRFGAMQGILRARGAALLEAAAACGFDGVELNVGQPWRDDPLWEPAYRAELQAASRRLRLAIPSLCLGALNHFGWKEADPQARQEARELVSRAIDVARELGAQLLLLPFFGRSELFTADEVERVVAGLREVAPVAEAAGVTLAVENTLSAAANLTLVSAVGSPAVGVYWDVSNARYWGHDPAAGIRELGTALRQVRFKDGRESHSDAMLGEGLVDFAAVAEALREVAYAGWVVLETPAGADPLANARRNLAFARRVMAPPSEGRGVS